MIVRLGPVNLTKPTWNFTDSPQNDALVRIVAASPPASDHFFGFSLGSGMTLARVPFDFAETFRPGTVQAKATDTTGSQYGFLASLIYHL